MYDYLLPPKLRMNPHPFNMMFNKIIVTFVSQNRIIGIAWTSCITFNTKNSIKNVLEQTDIFSVLDLVYRTSYLHLRFIMI